MKSIKFLSLALFAMLMSTAFAPVAKPTTPALKSPIKSVVVVDPAAVTLTWNKSTTTDPGNVTDYDVEMSTSSALITNILDPNYGGFVTPLAMPAGCNVPVVLPATATYSCVVDVSALPGGYGKTYYWHVQAHDGSATPNSAWSPRGVFRVAIAPPATLTVSDSADFTLRPIINWTLIPLPQNAQSYTIQMSVDCGFSTIYRTITASAASIPANQYTFPSDLPANMTYCWRIRANSSVYGASAWFPTLPATVTYTTTNPPTIPVLVSPANGAVVNDGMPTLKWKPGVYVPSDLFPTEFYTYEIAIYNTSNVNTIPPPTPIKTFCFDSGTIMSPPYTVECADVPANVVVELGDITTTSMEIPAASALTSATIYYWRMRTIREVGAGPDYQHSAWSALWTLKIGIVGAVDGLTMNPGEVYGNVPGLTDPTLNTPTKAIPGYSAVTMTIPGSLVGDMGDNVRLLSLRPTFVWDPGAINGQSFNLQIASAVSGSCNIQDPNKSTFAAKIITANVSHLLHKYTPLTELPPNLVLCWRVQPHSTLYGDGLWSDVQIFLTANPPTVPKPLGPSVLLNNDNHPKLLWTQVDPRRVSDPTTTFGKYEVEISFKSTFAGYDYRGNIVAPYDEPPVDSILYPLDPPILPGNVITHSLPVPLVFTYPLRANVPDAYCPFYPAIDQAHHTDPADPSFEYVNDIDEPWYQLHELFDSVPVLPDLPTFGPLCGGRTYYWRVRAYNNYGEYSAWSTSAMLPIVVDPPADLQIGVADLVNPSLSSVVDVNDLTRLPTLSPPPVVDLLSLDSDAQDLRPVFKWKAPVYGANFYAYTIEISTSPVFSPGALFYRKSNVNGTEYQPSFDLPSHKVLYWRVFSRDLYSTYGTSLGSDVLTFYTPNPPATPTLISPALNSLVRTAFVLPQPPVAPPPFTPTFTWVPIGSADHYDIQVSTSKSFGTTVIDDTTMPASPYTSEYVVVDPPVAPNVALDPMKVYYWRVRSCDGSAPTPICSTWSTVFSFRTAVPAPINLGSVAPLLIKPTFTWDVVLGAQSYTVYYSTNPGCTALNLGSLTHVPSFTTPILLPSKTYYWCVRSNHTAYGPSSWSTDTYLTP